MDTIKENLKTAVSDMKTAVSDTKALIDLTNKAQRQCDELTNMVKAQCSKPKSGTKSTKKRSAPSTNTGVSSSKTTTKKSKQIAKKTEEPHCLIWVRCVGKASSRPGSAWPKEALRIIGVYPNKNAAERKKLDLMNQYECAGHGDILVGHTTYDEIDLVVRKCEEVDL